MKEVGDRSVPNETHMRIDSGLAFEESALDVGLRQVFEVVRLVPLESDVGAWNGEGIWEGFEV